MPPVMPDYLVNMSEKPEKRAEIEGPRASSARVCLKIIFETRVVKRPLFFLNPF